MRSEALYRVLLFMLPGSLRTEYGEDMLQAFRDLRNHDGRSVLAIWAQAIPDLFITVIYERKESVMSKKALGVGGALLASAVAYGLVLVGTGGSILRAAVVIAAVYAIGLVILGIAALIGRKMDAPIERRTSLRHNWWVPIPLLFGLGYMTVGIRGLMEGEAPGDIVGFLVSALLAALAIFGVFARFRRVDLIANWVIIVACLPAFTVFWFPPIPAMGLVAVIASASEIFASRRRRKLAPS